MTKYSVSTLHNGEWTGIALFADNVSFEAMEAFCLSHFDCGNALNDPANDIAITDLTTGEVIWSISDAISIEEEDYEPDYDEMGFNPYEGCYDYDC